MSRFKTPLIIEDHGDGWYTVREPLVYESDILKGDVTAEAGFRTDYASAPAVCWWLRAGTKLDAPAVIHDRLYKTGDPFTKAQCDAVFYEALVANGVPKYRAWYCYQAVNWFGRWAWNNHRKHDAQSK